MQYDFRPSRRDHSGIVVPLFLAAIAIVALVSASIPLLSWRMPLRIIGLLAIFLFPLCLFRYQFLYYSYRLLCENGNGYLEIYMYLFGRQRKTYRISLCDIVAIEAYPAYAKDGRRMRKKHGISVISFLRAADYRVNLFPASAYLLTGKGSTPCTFILEIDEPFAALISEISENKI